MWLKETKPVCCIDHEPLPSDIKCMTSDICQEFADLYRRHQNAFIKNERITEMAKMIPRQRKARFVDKCPCYLKKAVEIIRLEQRQYTRTEQLAYPKARRLLLFKEEVRKLFPPERHMNLNRLIRKSLFSVYSRLGNVQPPLERKPVPKWDKKEWALHTKKLKRLAKPKVAKMPPKLPVKSKPLSEMRRYKKLAKPKKYVIIEKADWFLTPELRKHKASIRTVNLAKPIIRDTSMLYTELPIKIPPGVLKHKASQRLAKLAEPSARRTAQSATAEFKENPFAVSPNALKTKASKRTAELAEPKEYENKHIREDPYTIPKAVLNAKAKPRTIELAKPRKR